MFLLGSCKPNTFKPASKLLLGTWIKSPQGDTLETWTFTEDKLVIKVGDDTLYFENPESGYQPYIDYTLKKKLTQVRLYPDGYFYDPSRDPDKPAPYFLFLKLKKQYMYLYSVDDNIKGGIQIEFTK